MNERTTCLDPWNGRRQKPVVNGRKNEKLSLPQQMIHEMRMRALRGSKPRVEYQSLNHSEQAFDAPRLERPTRFNPATQPGLDGATETAADTALPPAGEARAEIIRRKKSTPKRKLTPGGARNAKPKTKT